MHKLCRIKLAEGDILPALLEGGTVRDLRPTGVKSLSEILESGLPKGLKPAQLPQISLDGSTFLAPVERQEVWAAGVTYLRSKKARMEESEFSASAYDRVYEAARPELFFKSLPEKVVGPHGEVGIRQDARWNVPEPELALVINSRHELVGFTIGNDMSSRDIEGENLLYLPQAKTYQRSCALGPVIVLGATEEQARTWTIAIEIKRGGAPVFSGQTSAGQIKRSFSELISYLTRCQEFPNGVILLTGTGVVPADDFTLAPADLVSITISEIGTLSNPVVQV